MSVLELSHVTRRYGNFVAVDDVSFTVDKGEILSLLGPSGCGKTTTLRLISGFEEANEGAVIFSGKDMQGKRPYEREVGLLFQDYALFPHMTVEQNVAYGLKHRGFDRNKIPARTAEMLELVKLTGFEKRRPGQLSGGQQQRLRFELKEILSAVNATTIVVTHDQEEAMSLGDNVIVMSDGKIMQQGHPTEIYANPRTRFVAEFIGRSNWFSGRLGATTAASVQEFVTVEGIRILVPHPDGSGTGDGGYEICIRPERIRINPAGNAPADTPGNSLPGTILDVAHLGADIHLVIEIAGKRLVTATEQYNGQPLEQTGEDVILNFSPDDCIIVPADS
jgi:putative spermidine/putrescine transport system ATP-binding protein/putrescine transport system ATP-binding protein